MIDGKIFIGEIKTVSPFGFRSPHSFNFLMNLCIENPNIDWISVHTSALWGGDLETVAYVSQFTNKPILAKGLHSSDKTARQAVEYGATYCLIYNRVPDPNNISMNRVLLEFNDIDSIRELISGNSYARKYMYVHNSRDLKTGQMKSPESLENFAQLDLRWKCQASGIKSLKDVHPNVNAFIVGENLVNICEEISHL